MKAKTIFGLILILGLSVSANYAREYTFTTSTTNITAAMAKITDPPSMAKECRAIIVATRVSTTSSIQHPIGVWYYGGQWYLFNSDNNNISVGLTYKLEFYFPGPNQFLHTIAASNLANGSSFIDHPLLNNHPNAQFKILQNYAPDYRPNVRNPNEAAAFYDATIGKWYLRNINGSPLNATTAYNIVIASSLIGSNPNTDTPVGETTSKNPTPISPGSTTPAGNAGGDLNGTYPNPKVIGLLGRPLSTVEPTNGQMLRYNGSQWEPVTINSGTTFTPGVGLTLDATVLNTKNSLAIWNAAKILDRDLVTTDPNAGQVLKWGGGSWYPADDDIGLNSAPDYNAGAGLSLNGTTFSSQNTAPMWNANQIAGGKISTTTPPTAGQVLKWNGTEWAPAKDEVAASTAVKPSVKFFTQSAMVNMYDPNVNSKPIVGLDNQTFELEQDSRIVFTTVIEAKTWGLFQANNTGVNLRVEILNTSNAPVAWSTSSAILFHDASQGINSTGIALLPKGKYHTKVTFIRQEGGAQLDVYDPGIFDKQGGHLIIKIFPN